MNRFLQNERFGPRILVAALVTLTIGALFLVALAIRLSTLPWGLDSNGPTVTSVEGREGWLGDYYFIEHAGQRYTCTGAETGKPKRHDEIIVFDPADPSRCRLARTVGRVGRAEWGAILTGLQFTLVGLPFLLWRLAYRGVFFPFAKGTPPSRPRLLRAANILFVAAIVLTNAIVVARVHYGL